LLCSDSYYPHPGGVSEYMHFLAQHLRALGCDVVILAPHYAEAYEDRIPTKRLGRCYLINANMATITITFHPKLPMLVRDFIKQELRYPEAAKSEGISGRVFVQFVVRRDGTVDDVTVVRGINEELDQEAIRVVQSSPKWNPGIHNGKPVNVSYSFPVVFTLD